MSRGPGRIEREILRQIQADSLGFSGKKLPARVSGWTVAHKLYNPARPGFPTPWGWEPSRAQLKAVTRALHSFVRKHQQYALMGGKGRKRLVLYDAADPDSVLWAELTVSRRGFVPFMEVRRVKEAG